MMYMVLRKKSYVESLNVRSAKGSQTRQNRCWLIGIIALLVFGGGCAHYTSDMSKEERVIARYEQNVVLGADDPKSGRKKFKRVFRGIITLGFSEIWYGRVESSYEELSNPKEIGTNDKGQEGLNLSSFFGIGLWDDFSPYKDKVDVLPVRKNDSLIQYPVGKGRDAKRLLSLKTYEGFSVQDVSVAIDNSRISEIISFNPTYFEYASFVKRARKYVEKISRRLGKTTSDSHKGSDKEHVWRWEITDNHNRDALVSLYGFSSEVNGKERWIFVFRLCDREGTMLGSLADETGTAIKDPVDEGAEFQTFDHQRRFSSGTGFSVSTNGMLMTNYHVVKHVEKYPSLHIAAVLDGKIYRANIVNKDTLNDLAILKIERETVPISWGEYVRLGQDVMTIGFPVTSIQGYSPKVTKGSISSMNGMFDDVTRYQIDVPIQPGNSGGALFDSNGRVVGVVVSRIGEEYFKICAESSPQSVNYAIKGDYAKALCKAAGVKIVSRKSNESCVEDVVEHCMESVAYIFLYR